jgi:hypothetical protein
VGGASVIWTELGAGVRGKVKLRGRASIAEPLRTDAYLILCRCAPVRELGWVCYPVFCTFVSQMTRIFM